MNININDLKRSCVVPQEWDLRTQYVAFSHNLSTHESGESPFSTIFGRNPVFPSAIDPSLIPTPYCVDVAGFKELVAENIAEICERARAGHEKTRVESLR